MSTELERAARVALATNDLTDLRQVIAAIDAAEFDARTARLLHLLTDAIVMTFLPDAEAIARAADPTFDPMAQRECYRCHRRPFIRVPRVLDDGAEWLAACKMHARSLQYGAANAVFIRAAVAFGIPLPLALNLREGPENLALLAVFGQDRRRIRLTDIAPAVEWTDRGVRVEG